MFAPVTFWHLLKLLMKELDEMEKINAKLSVAVEEVTLEHCKKNEVIQSDLAVLVFYFQIVLLLWATLMYLKFKQCEQISGMLADY